MVCEPPLRIFWPSDNQRYNRGSDGNEISAIDSKCNCLCCKIYRTLGSRDNIIKGSISVWIIYELPADLLSASYQSTRDELATSQPTNKPAALSILARSGKALQLPKLL